MSYTQYRRTAVAEMMDWTPDVDMTGVSVSEADKKAGSPKPGDKIARNPVNHEDRWLVAAAYFEANFEPLQKEFTPYLPHCQANTHPLLKPYDCWVCGSSRTESMMQRACMDCGEIVFESVAQALVKPPKE
jgi:hypothetical protein